MFNKTSGIVKTWVAMILIGIYSFDDVPKLLNLRTAVGEVLDLVGIPHGEA
ncbi:MAG TPA: hypothetical protein P5539_13895 [Mesotoga sp.]|nr:hypothetical protein [Mesotoga sp.]